MAVKEFVTEFVTKYAFRFMLWQGLFLVELQAFIVNSCFGRLIW